MNGAFDAGVRLLRKARTAARLLRRDPVFLADRLGLGDHLRSGPLRRAREYLHREGVSGLFVGGSAGEFTPEGPTGTKAVDLANVHRIVRARRPQTVIEFGCGYSTLAMAHALSVSGGGRLHVVEASEKWAANTQAKVPAHLRPYIEWHVQTPRIIWLGRQLCHTYDRLPDVRPDFWYLDGPDPRDVTGEWHGLTMAGRFVVAADPLLYEWSLYPGFVLVVDGRQTNVEFLRRNLQRSYRIRRNALFDFSTFELVI